MAVSTKIGREFFLNIRKKFSSRQVIYQKYFIKSLKLSYSFMPNISTVISWGNSQKLKRNRNAGPQIVTALRKKTAPSREGVKQIV